MAASASAAGRWGAFTGTGVGAWAAACSLLVTAVAAARPGANDLDRRVESAISAARLGEGRAGVSIVDVRTGLPLASVRNSEAFAPASNMKLLTTGTALLVLGSDFEFRTEVLIDGGRVIVRGSGDPALADRELLDKMQPRTTVTDILHRLAGAVRDAGCLSAEEVVIDDRVFDRVYVHPKWKDEHLDKGYGAPVSGLNFHANLLSMFVAPAEAGVGFPPSFTLEPEAPWLEIDNRAKVVKEKKSQVWLSRTPGVNRFTLHGEMGPTRATVEIPLQDTPLFFGQLFAAALLGEGVAVGGQPAPGGTPKREDVSRAFDAVRLVRDGESLPQGRVVAVVTTHIRDVVDRCNGESQNLYAEALLKRVGREVSREPGSWDNGAAVVRMTLAERVGPDANATSVIVDGSGLSTENRVSPSTLTRWLRAVQADASAGDTFVESLATPGEGTLRRRFQGVRLKNSLRAKSGLIDGVRCLSGYVTNPNTGDRVAFSVLVNGLKGPEADAAALKLHEEIVRQIDQWMTPTKGKNQ